MARRAVSPDRKKGAIEGRIPVFIDEAAFYLLPAAVATYAPVGQTPVLHELLTRDHLSAISAVTPEGRLRMQLWTEAITGPRVVRFLEHLDCSLPGGKFTLFWDGAPIHRSRVVQQFLARAPAGRFQVERVPAYAPDLNPDEGVWEHLKGDDLANVSCLDLRELRREIHAATQRLQRHPEVVRGFFREAGYG